jgi:hypothetical protein
MYQSRVNSPEEVIMRTLLTGMCALALSFAGGAVAQDKSTASKSSTDTTQTTTKTTGNNKSMKTTSEVVSGKVDSYSPGKSISVTVPGTIVKTKSFDLNDKNETVHMGASVKKGDWVKVTEKTDNNGHKTLTVMRSKSKTSS